MATDGGPKIDFYIQYFSRFNAEVVFQDVRENEYDGLEYFWKEYDDLECV